MLEVESLFFSYGKNEVLRNVNFNVPKGSIFGLIGSNGAALLQILLGLLNPDEGQIEIVGYDYKKLPRGKVGFLSERPYYHLNFSLKEYLFYLGKISSHQITEKQIDEAIKLVSLESSRNELLRNFSKGMLQRVGLAQTFLHRPELLILDEPMTGLDPVGQSKIREIILRINQKGTTVLITSHNLYEIERLSDVIGVLHNGQINIISNETLNKKEKIELEVNEKSIELSQIFAELAKVKVNDNKLIFPANDDDLYYTVMQLLLSNNLKVNKLTTFKASLEEITLAYLVESSDKNG